MQPGADKCYVTAKVIGDPKKRHYIFMVEPLPDSEFPSYLLKNDEIITTDEALQAYLCLLVISVSIVHVCSKNFDSNLSMVKMLLTFQPYYCTKLRTIFGSCGGSCQIPFHTSAKPPQPTACSSSRTIFPDRSSNW